MSDTKAGLAPYLSSLNPEQLAAVRHEGTSLLILAGAGSGKTRVITTKIAYLVRERGIDPASILAVTFTNKAAREMRDRAASLEQRCSRSVIRTFHSFGAWFLRRNAQAAGLDPNFVIYDDDDATTLLHGLLPQNTRIECSRMAQAIARAKDYGLEPDSPDLSLAFSEPQMRRIYQNYQERLKATGNVDFGDLIRLPAKLLREDDAVRRRTRQRFRVILVDEYQDSNVAQFELLRALAGAEPGIEAAYLCVVGDDDQSIYRFRGAELRNILEFSRIFPGTDMVRLETNYRSYQSILDIAGEVVSHNSGRLGKTLRAERVGGKLPTLALLEDQDQEAAFCARVCLERRKAGGSWNDVAILYRTNAQSLSFEKEFPRHGIPFRLVGALGFYEREEVKDTLAYLKILANPRDEVAFKRAVNKPSRGVGDTSVEAVMDGAAEKAGNLLAASAACAESLRGKARSGLRDFLAILEEARGRIWSEAPASADAGASPPANAGDPSSAVLDEAQADGMRRTRPPEAGETSLSTMVERLVMRSGLSEYHRNQDEIAGTQKIANLDELINASSLYPASLEGLSEYLETIELDRSLAARDNETDAVTLITMHNTKGLEFPLVMVTGLEQGLFPRDDDEGEELEEQRRLFYVAITRAKDLLYLTACRWRRLHGRLLETLPSRFLGEIGSERIEKAAGLSAKAEARPGFRYGPQAQAGSRRDEYAYAQARGGPSTGPERIWRAGEAVYHDDYGAGVVIKVSPTPSSGPLVVVRFETGKQAQFFPKFTTKLEAQRG